MKGCGNAADESFVKEGVETEKCYMTRHIEQENIYVIVINFAVNKYIFLKILRIHLKY